MKTIQEHHAAFLEAVGQLNLQQRQAVQQIEGPVLVVAGPGTGKTHILSTRIGQILLQTDTQAHNILCLTFTDAGVHAMRDRLLQMIGPEAHRVHIFTFHSFCNTVIQENMELFGRQGLEPLNDLERVELTRQMLDELPPGHPLRRGASDAYQYEKHLQDLFQRMKAEGWTPDFVQDRIDQFLATLPERPEYRYQRNTRNFKKGDLKQALFEKTQLQMRRLSEAVALFERYEQLMRQRQRYDYEDMILWVLKAFQQNEVLLRSYQERYLYFLLDEFQDTNGAQNAILQTLIGFWENPNLFIVGDDDQSIYEFQGARLQNLLEYYQTYKDYLELVVLTHNYRSAQPILDAARALIHHNEKRIIAQIEAIPEKNLRAENPDVAQIKRRPVVLEYQNPWQELGGVVQQIETLQKEGVPLEEIAVIFAKHKQAIPLIDCLEKKEIPYAVKRRVNVLDVPLIVQFRWLLEYLYLEQVRPYQGESLLFKILHATFTEIEEGAIARLSAFLARQAHEQRPAWRDLLEDAGQLEGVLGADAAPLLRFGATLREARQQTGRMALPRFIELLINRMGLLDYALAQVQKDWYIRLLHSLLEFVKRETLRQPRLTLARLLETFRKMDANNLSLELQDTLQSEKGVQLVTAHSAKGLEFERVFLLGCSKYNWEPQSRNSSYRFQYPDTLTFSGEEDPLEARRRLFYVGMTRAKQGLVLTYSRQDNRGKDQARALFVDELLQAEVVDFEPAEVPDTYLLDLQFALLKERTLVLTPHLPKEMVDEMLKSFQLSVSTFNQFLRCPLSFYYEHILQVPTVYSEAASYGTAIHYALQRYFELLATGKRSDFPPASVLVQHFEQELQRLAGYLSEEGFQFRLELGRNYLPKYLEQRKAIWAKKVKLELDVRNVEIDGVPIKGVIDKVELLKSPQVQIVDYKTGRLDEQKLRPPTPARPYGGTYWRQLLFYRLLLQESQRWEYEVVGTAIDYVEPDPQGQFKWAPVTFNAGALSQMREWIVDVYQRIQAHEFYEGCNEPNCAWCAFVRLRQATNSFSDSETEALDD